MDFDNVGFLVGRADAAVSRILVSLDITRGVISEALDIGAALIVSHHPLFFSLKSVTDADVTGGKVVRLLSGGVSAICMHTNLDAAYGGTNDALAIAAGIAGEAGETELLSEDGFLPDGTAFSYGRVGYLKNPLPLSEYLDMLKESLKSNGFRYFDAGSDVYKVAVVGGAGGSELHHAVRHGCDTFVTSDVKYDVFLEAKELGINLIDGDHFCTENPVTGVLADKLRAAFPEAEVAISKSHGQTVRFC
jgi:dinuclear metal center YbgI/SA1388 family protein